MILFPRERFPCSLSIVLLFFWNLLCHGSDMYDDDDDDDDDDDTSSLSSLMVYVIASVMSWTPR